MIDGAPQVTADQVPKRCLVFRLDLHTVRSPWFTESRGGRVSGGELGQGVGRHAGQVMHHSKDPVMRLPPQHSNTLHMLHVLYIHTIHIIYLYKYIDKMLPVREEKPKPKERLFTLADEQQVCQLMKGTRVSKTM